MNPWISALQVLAVNSATSVLPMCQQLDRWRAERQLETARPLMRAAGLLPHNRKRGSLSARALGKLQQIEQSDTEP
jgi:hypothetical protein